MSETLVDEEQRLRFRDELASLLENGKCYYQPPESVKMEYPCFVYERARFHQLRADNKRYRSIPCWSVTLIVKSPQDAFITKVLDRFQMASFDRSFTTDNLNHYAFTIYY